MRWLSTAFIPAPLNRPMVTLEVLQRSTAQVDVSVNREAMHSAYRAFIEEWSSLQFTTGQGRQQTCERKCFGLNTKCHINTALHPEQTIYRVTDISGGLAGVKHGTILKQNLLDAAKNLRMKGSSDLNSIHVSICDKTWYRHTPKDLQL